ncbi:MAG: 2-oxoacid:acceptor oxidoreductase family protein [Thermodesulfobacteriota bacterium]
MYQDVIIAGFGGQGVMLIGNLLAYAAMDQGLKCTFMPVYGVEMRGGTANCTVVISDEDIGSPIVFSPKSLIVMNQPSVDKFQPRLQDGGVLVANTSIIDPAVLEQDRIRSFLVPANSIAEKLGTGKMANMVMLGAWLKATGCLQLETVQGALDRVFSKQNSRLIPLNEKGLAKGAEQVRGI